MASLVNEKDIAEALSNGDGARLAHLATAEPIRTLAYLDGWMRGLIVGPRPAAELEWLVKMDVVLRRWLRLESAGGSGITERDVDVAIMRGAYLHGSLFLVVGAGVSMGAGLSGWKDLVIKVLNFALELGSEKQRSRVDHRVRDAFTSAPNAAEEKVQQSLADLTPLKPEDRLEIEALLKQLAIQETYSSDDLLHATQVAKRCLGERYFDHLKGVLYFSHRLKGTRTHLAIARMVRPKELKAMTPRVFSILTYNFDDLLEKAVWHIGFGFKAHCSRKGEWIFQSGSSEDKPVAIDLYHIHGFVPGEMRCPPDIDLVFSAEEYELAYGKDNSITRVIHETYLGNAPGLVLGSSLTDKYAVQQMTKAHNEKPGWYHYAMMGLPDEHSREHYRAMGLRVLWYNDRDEIPQLLDEIAGIPKDGGGSPRA